MNLSKTILCLILCCSMHHASCDFYEEIDELQRENSSWPFIFWLKDHFNMGIEQPMVIIPIENIPRPLLACEMCPETKENRPYSTTVYAMDGSILGTAIGSATPVPPAVVMIPYEDAKYLSLLQLKKGEVAGQKLWHAFCDTVIHVGGEKTIAHYVKNAGIYILKRAGLYAGLPGYGLFIDSLHYANAVGTVYDSYKRSKETIEQRNRYNEALAHMNIYIQIDKDIVTNWQKSGLPAKEYVLSFTEQDKERISKKYKNKVTYEMKKIDVDPPKDE